MIKQSIFREYDIRGIYKKELHEQSVKLIGYFLGNQQPRPKGTEYEVDLNLLARRDSR